MKREPKGRGRRGNGEGSIYQDARGLWRAVVSIQGGGRKYLSGATRADVRRKLRDAQRAVERGTDLAADRITIADWCDQWLATKRQLEITTRSKYEVCIRVHIKPALIGRISLAKLRTEDVEAWMDDLEAKGLGGARRQTLLKILRSALRAAEPRGYLPRGNPALYAEMPQAPKRRRRAPDPDRVSRLLATVRDDPRLEAFVLLCLGGGLRRGEVLGLRWGAIDLDSGRIEVRARVSRVSSALGGLIVRPGAKSEAGERVTFVAPFVVDALRRLRTRVRQARLAKGPAWMGEDDPAGALAHVFVTGNGTIWSPEDAHKTFKRACVRAGLDDDQSFHGLRHDFASLLARLGVSLRVAMDMLGHSHELMTIYYQHASDDDRRQAADKVGEWLLRVTGSVQRPSS